MAGCLRQGGAGMSQGSRDGRLEAHCNRGTGTVLWNNKDLPSEAQSECWRPKTRPEYRPEGLEKEWSWEEL